MEVQIMPPKKVKKQRKTKSCPEEITEKERLEELGIYKDEDDDESWRDYG
jgi:hypothetical protein